MNLFARHSGLSTLVLVVLLALPAQGDPGLVSRFTFDNHADLGDDTGSFDNDGTPVGDAQFTTDAVLGGGALLLDGSGDLIDLGTGTGTDYTTELVDDGDGFTLSCWAFIPASSTNDLSRFFSAYMPGGWTTEGWGAGHRTSDRLFATTYGKKDYDTISGSAPARGAWHHYAFVYSNDPISRIDFYVDKTLADSVSTTSTGMNPATSVGFAIGALGLPGAEQYFDGRLDDLRIYDYELSAGEIGTLYDEAGDFIYNQWVASYGLDPAGNGAPDQDPDNDGSSNQQEFERHTFPNDPDSDDDGLDDGVETDTGIYLSATDTGSDPLDSDSDDDGFSDGAEVNTLLSDPNDPEDPNDSDLDDDGLPNTWETTYGLDPNDDGSIDPDNGAEGDPDGDGLPNRDEYFLGSSPVNPQDPDGRAWQPRPEKAHLLVISTHPDDEGIFFGGLLPYATQVRRLNTVLVNMVSDRVANNPTVREGELRGAAWQYGLRNQPVFARFMDHAHLGSINSLTLAWDVWDGNDTDGVADDNFNGIPDGREVGALYIAEQIRRYRPEVVASHDIAGEYGHGAHQASALCTIDAFTLAADPAADIAGLPPWQTKKLYIHKYGTDPLFHDFWEDATIDDGGVMKSPRQVADEGLDFHVTQGRPNVSTVYAVGEVPSSWAPHPGEWWGLYATTVGSDTVEPDFIAPDSNNSPITYSGWARGDFFENLTVFPDSDSDTLPDDWELDHFASLAAADPQADDDHDGLDNHYEFVSGLDPHTPDRSELVIAADAASVDFTVPGTTGVTGYEGLTRRYQLLYSPDMLDWSTVVAEGVADDGTSLSYLIGDAGENGDRGFYRLALSIE